MHTQPCRVLKPLLPPLPLKVSLQVAPSQVAREYYTEEEMVKFKKPKKKRKVKKTLLRVCAGVGSVGMSCFTLGGCVNL